ncbi:5'/3'-nucleotidase SurE [Bacillota bacterium LX-D]|nr:5'/3'-nucleotidase SurE [Bacillota bacterium LX-D]
MKILLTNDDGIDAQGIKYLQRSLLTIAEVFTVAPERERSAAGHGITMHKPLRVNKVLLENESYGYSVSGTPADCVKLALDKLLDHKPDFVVSGINNGFNLGTDIIYSGTVSAAIEAIINGVPAIAVSVEEGALSEDLVFVAETVKKLILQINEIELDNNALINVNVPCVSKGPVKGLEITSQGLRLYENSVEVRKDPRGKDYYWLGGQPIALEAKLGTDVAALEHRSISLTPLGFDLTNYELINYLKSKHLKPF